MLSIWYWIPFDTNPSNNCVGVTTKEQWIFSEYMKKKVLFESICMSNYRTLVYVWFTFNIFVSSFQRFTEYTRAKRIYTRPGATCKMQNIIENCVICLILNLFGDDNCFLDGRHIKLSATYIVSEEIQKKKLFKILMFHFQQKLIVIYITKE